MVITNIGLPSQAALYKHKSFNLTNTMKKNLFFASVSRRVLGPATGCALELRLAP